MGSNDVQFVKALWEASPVLGIVVGFLLFILLLARLGLLNFRVTDTGYYDKVQEIKDVKDQQRELAQRIVSLEREFAVMKAVNAERQRRDE